MTNIYEKDARVGPFKKTCKDVANLSISLFISKEAGNKYSIMQNMSHRDYSPGW